MSRSKTQRWLLLSLVLGVAAASSIGQARAQADADGRYLVFGFLPIVSSEHLVRRFSPLTDYLSRELGVRVRMETAPDFADFIRRTQEEKRYDLLFTAPHLYYLAEQKAGYRAVVGVDKAGMKAVIVAPQTSGLRSLHDLRGHRLATTDPLALATVLVRSLLLESGIDPDRDLTLVATPSHNASLLSSYRGATDASALMLPLFLQSRPEIQEGMHIVAETPSVPHMPIAVASWVDADIAHRLRDTLLNMADDTEGRVLLDRLAWPGFTTVRADEYDSLRWIAEQAGIK